jgi:outer membrane receptor protein involved in Fe transport
VVNTGNPALRPQRAWTYEIAYERRFWGAGSVVATATHARLQDVVDQTAIGGVSAVGNIGDGARDTIQLVLSAPLARLGLAQGRLSVNGIWRDSHVRDPFTGADRGISDEIQREGSVVLSNDVARWKSTWTLAATEGVRQTRYRVSEISRSGLQTTVDASWEYKPGGGLAVLVQIKDLFGRDRTLSRDLFAGARGATPPGLSLVQRVSQAPYLYVRLRRAF